MSPENPSTRKKLAGAMSEELSLEDLISQFETDSAIDKTEIGEAALISGKLHARWYRHYAREKKTLRNFESAFKKLRLRKQEFYLQGHDDLSRSLGWKLPPQGKVLKGEVAGYVDADDDVVNAAVEVGLQQEKVQFLESTLKWIANRNFSITNYIAWVRFTSGAG